MKKQSLNSHGFTVLELLLFVLVVGIIAASAYSRVEHEKQSTRNKEREGDTKSIQLAVEGYFARTASYPKTDDLSNPEWVSTNLKGIDNSNLTDPKGAGINKSGGYTYTATKDGKEPCTDAAVTCLKYTLSSDLERKPKIELSSLN